jgi:acyl carrier protein
MKKSEFIEELIDTLELEDNSDENTEIAEYLDSLGILSLIALIDQHFNKRYSAEDIRKVTSVKSLISMIGIDKFED